MVESYLATLALTYLAMLGVYFGFGLGFERLARRHPGRKIQPGRDGLRRKGVEIRASMKALAMSAFLLGTGYFAQTQGWAMAPVALTPVSFVLGFLAALILFDLWFYLGHRLLHWGPMYRFHAEHHRSVAPTVWSNDSSGLVDTAIEHGFYLVVWFVLPVPALAILALRLFDQISGMIGHSGYEFFASPSARWPWPFICTSFHDLHHSGFTTNYGNVFSFWDRVFGTVHPEYDAMVARLERPETEA